MKGVGFDGIKRVAEETEEVLEVEEFDFLIDVDLEVAVFLREEHEAKFWFGIVQSG